MRRPVWPLTIGAPGEQGIAAPVCTPVIAARRPIRAQNDRLWHFPDIQDCPPNVGYRGQSGQHLLNLSFTAFDPNRTLAAEFADAQRGISYHCVVGCDPWIEGSV
jgi:hypothetical protein